jgi:DMSO reductase family type II enzyme heme b subunit
MQVAYVADVGIEALLDPDGSAWKAARAERVQMMGTPLGLQPTPAIQVAWANKKIGAVERVDVAAVNDGSVLAFRLEWSDATEDRALDDTTAFPDAAAILLPSVAGAPLPTMGAPGMAVNAWYWRADEQGKGRHVVAEGLGTSRTLDTELVVGRGIWKGGGWRVVIARPLRINTTEPVAQLEPGQTTQYGVAIWEGSHGERAGIKAFSIDWRDLRLQAAPSARR